MLSISKKFSAVFSALFALIFMTACATLGGGSGSDEDSDITIREKMVKEECERKGMELAEEDALYVRGVNHNWVSVNVYLRPKGASMPIRVASQISTGKEFGPDKVQSSLSGGGGVYLIVDPIGGAGKVQHPFRLEDDVGHGRATLLNITIGTDGVTQFAHSHVESYGIDCVPKD